MKNTSHEVCCGKQFLKKFKAMFHTYIVLLDKKENEKAIKSFIQDAIAHFGSF